MRGNLFVVLYMYLRFSFTSPSAVPSGALCHPRQQADEGLQPEGGVGQDSTVRGSNGLELAGIPPHTEFDLPSADNDAIRQPAVTCSGRSLIEQPSTLSQQSRQSLF